MMDTAHNPTTAEQLVREALARTVKFGNEQDWERTLRAACVESPVGDMMALGDDDNLFLLTFVEHQGMERKTALVRKKLNAKIEMGESAAIQSIRGELREYFQGDLTEFRTPVALVGTSFQVLVWEELRAIPYAASASYVDLANRIGKPNAFRAVAQASSQSPLSIIIPSHRVRNADGGPGGGNAGVDRKRWLLDFEESVLAKKAVLEPT